MLTRLLSRGARREQGKSPDHARAPAAPAAPLVAREDSLLLFVPMDGGMSFRLFAVDDDEAAAAFLRQEFPALGGKPLLFRPLRAGMRAAKDEQVEVLVVINDPSRPGTVYVSSFTDMESAESFVRFETRDGLDPSLVTLHRGVPQLIDTGPATGPYSTPVQPRPAPAPTAAPAVTVAIPKPPEPKRRPSVQPVVTAHDPAPKARPQPKTAAQVQPAGAERRGRVASIREWPGWDTLPERINAASTLKWQVWEEIKDDPIASGQARLIVAAVAAAGGVGAFWAGPAAVAVYTLAGLLGWLAGAHLTYWAGTIVFPGRTAPENKQLLFKAIAFSHAPRVLLIIGIVLPVIGIVLPPFASLMPLVVLAVLLWALAAMVPATQVALEIDMESATLAAITGWVALFAISFIVPALII